MKEKKALNLQKEKIIQKYTKSLLKLPKDIRSYSHSQKDLWQKVPYLALEVDGKFGFNEIYRLAYEEGYWVLCHNESKPLIVHNLVDLETGDIIQGRSLDSKIPKLASAIELIDLLNSSNSIDELDAQKIIKNLKGIIREHYPSYYNPKEQDEWRNRTREELGLEKLYKRKTGEEKVKTYIKAKHRTNLEKAFFTILLKKPLYARELVKEMNKKGFSENDTGKLTGKLIDSGRIEINWDRKLELNF